ncbi:MAG: ExbD/TolR family protein, partial [Terrimicrobiaceae bacterium]
TPLPALISMRRYSAKNNLQTLTELNITPLLDLAFVLLIIFMITTPLIENSLDLVVPKSSTAKGLVNPAEVFTIAVDKNNILKLNTEILTPEMLESRLAAMRVENPDISVVVRPHEDLAIQRFISVMDILQRVGIAKVGVMTRRDDNEAVP